MIIYFIFLSLSGAGSLFIIIRNFARFQNFEQTDDEIALLKHRSFFHEAEKYIAEPLKFFFENRFIPFLYKKIEKSAHQARIYILKFENKILKFNNYIKGKRILKTNGEPSEYIKKINGGNGNGNGNGNYSENYNGNNGNNSENNGNGIQKML